MLDRKFVLRRILAAVFGCAALFHAAAIVFPSLATGSTPARHAAFIVINGGLAAGFGLHASRRVAIAFASLFALLTVQQLWSHGGDAIHAWYTDHRIDIMSIGVVVLMPLAFILLLRSLPPGER